MVEVPEHLLKRSKERRAALGLGGGEASPGAETGESAATPAESPAAATPAAAAAKPAPKAEPPKAPEPPKPDPLYIQAAKQRQRLPWWSLPVFLAIPLWAWIFLRTLSPPEAEADPLALGQDTYSTCASCHGAGGEGGGNVPALTDVGETFPDFRDHLMWVKVGAADWPSSTYGAQNTEHTSTMPPYTTMTDEELAQVVLYERQTLGEIEAAEDEIGTTPDGEPVTEEDLLRIAEGELTFADVGVGTLSTEAGFTEENLG